MIKRIGIFLDNELTPSLVWWANASLSNEQAILDAVANIPKLLLQNHKLTDARVL